MRLRPEDKVTFYEGLNRLLSSGIPIDEALDGLSDEYNKNLSLFLIDLRSELIRGVTMSSVLFKYPHIFSSVEVNLIKAGEESGNLEEILESLAANVKEEILFKSKVVSALTYPAFLMFVFTFIFVGILMYVVPRFKGVFQRLKVGIPLPTQLLFDLSDLMINFWPLVLIGVAIVVISLFALYRLKRPYFISLLSSMPVARGIFNYLDIYKFSKTMYLLTLSGIPLVKALTLSKEVIYKKKMHLMVDEIIENVTNGDKLALGFKKYPRVFPSSMSKIIQYGEVSGSIEKSFKDISVLAESRAKVTLDRLGVLLEPVMVFVVGLMIGVFMIALIYPMYQMIGNVGSF
jgi:type II secretory pathway component PulF